MTKLLIATILTTVGVTAFAAETPTSRNLQRRLNEAVVGERAAIARYDAFAEKAKDEGFPGAADLFRAEAAAERVHLARFSAVMKERGLALPAEETPSIKVGPTRANLQAAISAEAAERDDAYLVAHRDSMDAHDDAIATLFDQTRDVETEHANLCASASRDLDRLTSPKPYFLCTHCGFTTDVHLGFCPVCRHDGMAAGPR